MIKGYNNGQYGYGMYGAFFPKSMGGPFGYQGYNLPIEYSFPDGIPNPRLILGKKSFGKLNTKVYQLTPNGMTTSPSWGYFKFSKKKMNKKKKMSRNKKRMSRNKKK